MKESSTQSTKVCKEAEKISTDQGSSRENRVALLEGVLNVNSRLVQSLQDLYVSTTEKIQIHGFLGFSIRPTEECIKDKMDRCTRVTSTIYTDTFVRARRVQRSNEIEGALRYSEIDMLSVLPLQNSVIAIIPASDIPLELENAHIRNAMEYYAQSVIPELNSAFHEIQHFDPQQTNGNLLFLKQGLKDDLQWLYREVFNIRSRCHEALYSRQVRRPLEAYDSRYAKDEYIRKRIEKHRGMLQSLSRRITSVLAGRECAVSDKWPLNYQFASS